MANLLARQEVEQDLASYLRSYTSRRVEQQREIVRKLAFSPGRLLKRLLREEDGDDYDESVVVLHKLSLQPED